MMNLAYEATEDWTPAPSLSEEVAVWENRVKEARGTGDPEATLFFAATGADAIEYHIDKHTNCHEDWNEDERAALTALKRFTFNAAADAWPGWQLDGPALDTQALAVARGLAQRSADWVERLKLGAVQEGTGIWLVGAFGLALGELDDALAHFSTASQRYRAAPAPGLALLTSGYEVIARGLRAQQSGEDIMRDLEEKVFHQISSGGFEDGAEWIEQLRTALKVFSKEKDMLMAALTSEVDEISIGGRCQ